MTLIFHNSHRVISRVTLSIAYVPERGELIEIDGKGYEVLSKGRTKVNTVNGTVSIDIYLQAA